MRPFRLIGQFISWRQLHLELSRLSTSCGERCWHLIKRLTLTASLMGLLAACGGGGGGSSSGTTPSAAMAANAMAVTVDAGPPGTGYNVNRLYTTITICRAGSVAACQTIDHILVDTGSSGLRVLSSVLDPALNLSRTPAPSGFPLLNCARFVDGTFAWGPVATADIQLGGKTALSAPIQIVGDSAYDAVSSRCATGRPVNTVSVLGAKGILGLGLLKEDCGSACATNPLNGFYFSCSNSACSAVSGTALDPTKQLRNPVLMFVSDNNGLVIDLPAVSGATGSSLAGAVYFGIGTQANNQFANGAVLSTNSLGYISSQFAGRTLANSFFDTGSNGLYFDTTTLAPCTGGTSFFYCPTASAALSATVTGANGQSRQISFSVDNATVMFATGANVLPALAGNIGDSRTFDWGLPFFYGRRVFFGIEGQSSNIGTGPFFAF